MTSRYTTHGVLSQNTTLDVPRRTDFTCPYGCIKILQFGVLRSNTSESSDKPGDGGPCGKPGAGVERRKLYQQRRRGLKGQLR
jgi:hypothetical protein